MPLPPSGPISIDMIRNEVGIGSFSLRALSAAAGKSIPDAMSEFYGWSPPTTTTTTTTTPCTNMALGFNRTNRVTACTNFNTGTLTGVGVVGSSFAAATSLKRADCSNTILAGVGFYSNGVIVRYWTGTAFTTQFDCTV